MMTKILKQHSELPYIQTIENSTRVLTSNELKLKPNFQCKRIDIDL